MSTELEKIKESIMDKILKEEIKMKPKLYFVLGSFLAFVGLIGSMMTSVFLVGLIRFSIRSHGPMGEYRLDQLLSRFPWWTAILAIVFLFVGIWIMFKYDFSHKIKPLHFVIGVILAVVITGLFIDLTGINDTLSNRGPMKGMMRGYMKNGNF